LPTLTKLESSIGYTFKDESLLAQALTHRSYSNSNYERLEFLGDSILNFVITASLYHQFEASPEGDLSRLRARMVKQKTLAEVARDHNIGSYLSMGSGELKSGGFERDSILSDALEAILGAIYLDSDFMRAAQCIRELFATRLESLSEVDLKKDAKSRLQEYLQAMGQPIPEYVLVAMKGKSPNQIFEIECLSNQFSEPLKAKGSSRRRAEQSVAELALKSLGVES
jgi:ribonuclease-3